MDSHKVYKILEHLGEGTITDIEKKVSSESSEFLESIKKDLTIDEDLEKDLSLDEILKSDLESLPTEEVKEDRFVKKEEEELGEIEEGSFDLDLGDLGGGEEEKEELKFEQEIDQGIEEEIKSGIEEGLGEKEEKHIDESGLSELESLMGEEVGLEEEKETIDETQKETKEESQVAEFSLSDFLKDIGNVTEVKDEDIVKIESEPSEEEKFGMETFDEDLKSEKQEFGEELDKIFQEISEEKPKVEEEKEEKEEKEEEFTFESFEGLEEEKGLEGAFGLEEPVPQKESTLEEEGEVSLEELGEIEEEKEKKKAKKEEKVLSYKDEMIDLSDLSELAQAEGEAEVTKYDIDLTDDDLEAIKTSLKTYPVWLSKNIKNLILNDALSPDELKTLLDMLITFAPYKNVANYLEKTLNIKVTPEAEVEEQIYIPSQFEIIWPYIKWTAISFFTLMIALVLFYFYIYIPQEAKKYYQIGFQALQEEKIEKAMENFRIATKTKLYPDWILKYADELINRKYYNIAIDILKNPGLVFYPDDIRFYFKISDALFEMGKIDESLKQLEALYANVKFAKDPRLYMEYAKKYERLKNYRDAIIVYQDGIRVIGDRIEFLLGILKNYIELKDLKNSDIYYKKILKKDKKFINEVVFTEYAFLLLRNNYDSEGKEIVDNLIKKKKSYPKAYYFLGVYYVKRKDVNLAMKNLGIAEKLVKLSKSGENLLPYIYNLQGEIIMNYGYEGYKDSSMASEKFNLALSEDKTFAKAYFNLGKIMYFEINDYKKAYEYMKLSKQYGYSNDFVDYILGWIDYQLGNYIDSLKTFIFLHNKYIDNVNLKHALGLNFIKLNQPELAIGYLQSAIGYWELIKYKAKRIDVNNPEVRTALLNLASLYNNIGVAYYNLYKETKNKEYAATALKYFLKSKEEYSWLNPNAVVNSESYVNSLTVLHPDIKRELFLMDSFQYFPKSIFDETDIFYY